MPWFWRFVAGLSEVAWAIGLKSIALLVVGIVLLKVATPA